MKTVLRFILVSALLSFSSLSSASNEQELRSAFELYIDAWSNYDVETVYEFLTPYSQNKLKFDAVEKIVLESDLEGRTNTIKVIRLREEGKSALLAYRYEIKTPSGIQSDMVTHTWKLIDGKWLRAFVEDREGEKGPQYAQELAFELEEYSYSWGISDSLMSSTKLFRPEVRFRVRNTGGYPIDNLHFRVQFLEEGKGIFSSATEYAISSGDLPLKRSELSETFFVKSDIGFEFDLIPSQAIKERARGIEPVLYFRSGYDSEWKRYSLE